MLGRDPPEIGSNPRNLLPRFCNDLNGFPITNEPILPANASIFVIVPVSPDFKRINPVPKLRIPSSIDRLISTTNSVFFCCSAFISSDHLVDAHPPRRNIRAVLTRPNRPVSC